MWCKISAHVDVECHFCAESWHSKGCSFLYCGKCNGILYWKVKVKEKVKVHPITGHEDPEGE